MHVVNPCKKRANHRKYRVVTKRSYEIKPTNKIYTFFYIFVIGFMLRNHRIQSLNNEDYVMLKKKDVPESKTALRCKGWETITLSS